MTKVTVAINAYNSMPYLPEAVESIRRQSLQDWRMIIVDDGSTDASAEYLDRLNDSRIEVIHQANSGTAAASNRIIAQCQTEYIVRMDADDISPSHRLERLLNFMEAHPQIGMAGTQAVWFGQSGFGSSLRLPLTHQAIRRALMANLHAMVHASVIQRTAVIRGIGGYWSYRQYDDEIDMMLRMSEAAEVANIDEVLYHYRVVPHSLQGNGQKRVYFSYNYAIELAKRRAKLLPTITPEDYQNYLARQNPLAKAMVWGEIYARTQYRRAVFDRYSNRRIQAGVRMMWAGLFCPRLSWQRLKRMLPARPRLAADDVLLGESAVLSTNK